MAKTVKISFKISVGENYSWNGASSEFELTLPEEALFDGGKFVPPQTFIANMLDNVINDYFRREEKKKKEENAEKDKEKIEKDRLAAEAVTVES